jgi:UDP-2-acetamido-2,6-beta-L-arabino-hexul-4-ose reductase
MQARGEAGATEILITGGRGFLGRNLVDHLRERKALNVRIADREDPPKRFEEKLLKADVIFHLAGVNRPKEPVEFERVNTLLTEKMSRLLKQGGRSPKIIFTSSIQAALDNPYGKSKLKAEQVLHEFGGETGACIRIYRLTNLFGKWCRPNYNSVTATFCHNIAKDLPIEVSDPFREIELSYVDDVVKAFLTEIDGNTHGVDPSVDIPKYTIQLGDLAGRIQEFHEMRETLTLPDFSDRLNRALYATYLSYVPSKAREYQLKIKSDGRGSLAEFVKGKHFGQVFISRTKPGATRGNHYHHTKTEKFLVVEGKGLIRMRLVEGSEVDEYSVTGDEFQVIDIPPGFTHSITNVGTDEMVTLFWSSEIFDPNRSDTFFLPVDV